MGVYQYLIPTVKHSPDTNTDRAFLVFPFGLVDVGNYGSDDVTDSYGKTLSAHGLRQLRVGRDLVWRCQLRQQCPQFLRAHNQSPYMVGGNSISAWLVYPSGVVDYDYYRSNLVNDSYGI